MAIRSTGAPGRRVDAIARRLAGRRVEPHQRRLARPAAPAEMRGQHRGDAAHDDRRRAPVVDGQADVARGERRRRSIAVSWIRRPRHGRSKTQASPPTRVHCAPSSDVSSIDALAEVGAVDVELEAIERGGGARSRRPTPTSGAARSALRRGGRCAGARPCAARRRRARRAPRGRRPPTRRRSARPGWLRSATSGGMVDGHEAVRPRRRRPARPAAGTATRRGPRPGRPAPAPSTATDTAMTAATIASGRVAQEPHGCFLPAKRW